jgi:hypothetical protein
VSATGGLGARGLVRLQGRPHAAPGGVEERVDPVDTRRRAGILERDADGQRGRSRLRRLPGRVRQYQPLRTDQRPTGGGGRSLQDAVARPAASLSPWFSPSTALALDAPTGPPLRAVPLALSPRRGAHVRHRATLLAHLAAEMKATLEAGDVETAKVANESISKLLGTSRAERRTVVDFAAERARRR